MITIDVHAEESFARIQTILQGVPGGVEKAMYGVISRATTSARTTTLKGITSIYDIKEKDVRDRKQSTINVRTRKVDSGVIGQITFSGAKIPLYRFGVSHKKPKSNGKVPVNFDGRWALAPRYTTVKARQRKDRGMTQFDNVFIANMSSGHTGLFERNGSNRFPISEIMGAATAQMASDSGVLEQVEKEALETIVKRTEHEITRILNGYGG